MEYRCGDCKYKLNKGENKIVCPNRGSIYVLGSQSYTEIDPDEGKIFLLTFVLLLCVLACAACCFINAGAMVVEQRIVTVLLPNPSFLVTVEGGGAVFVDYMYMLVGLLWGVAAIIGVKRFLSKEDL